MSKKNKKAEIVETTIVETAPVAITTAPDGVDLTKLTKEELHLRRLANVAKREELANENKYLVELYKTATSSGKMAAAQSKLEKLQAQLAALQNPTVADTPVVEVPAATSEELAM